MSDDLVSGILARIKEKSPEVVEAADRKYGFGKWTREVAPVVVEEKAEVVIDKLEKADVDVEDDVLEAGPGEVGWGWEKAVLVARERERMNLVVLAELFRVLDHFEEWLAADLVVKELTRDAHWGSRLLDVVQVEACLAAKRVLESSEVGELEEVFGDGLVVIARAAEGHQEDALQERLLDAASGLVSALAPEGEGGELNRLREELRSFHGDIGVRCGKTLGDWVIPGFVETCKRLSEVDGLSVFLPDRSEGGEPLMWAGHRAMLGGASCFRGVFWATDEARERVKEAMKKKAWGSGGSVKDLKKVCVGIACVDDAAPRQDSGWSVLPSSAGGRWIQMDPARYQKRFAGICGVVGADRLAGIMMVPEGRVEALTALGEAVAGWTFVGRRIGEEGDHSEWMTAMILEQLGMTGYPELVS